MLWEVSPWQWRPFIDTSHILEQKAHSHQTHLMGPCHYRNSVVHFCTLVKVSKTPIGDDQRWNKNKPKEHLRHAILKHFRVCVHICVSCDRNEVSGWEKTRNRTHCWLCWASSQLGWSVRTVASTLLSAAVRKIQHPFSAVTTFPPVLCPALILRDAEASLMTSAGPQQSFL